MSNVIADMLSHKCIITYWSAVRVICTAKHINTPPVAVISPSSQTVKLPNSGAVLDGSSSSDDDKIVSWHWELQQGPLGYQPHLQDTSTLQLDNLVVPGNYTFK